MGICETRWKRSGDKTNEDHQIIYAGGESHERGVAVILDRERARCVLVHWPLKDRILLMKIQGRPFSISIIVVYAPTSNYNEEEIDVFYDNLDMTKAQFKSHKIIIVMEDLNAKVGGAQLTTKSLLTLCLNMTPEDNGLGKVQEGT